MAFDEAITKGTTGKILEVMLRDSSTGAGKTGVAFGDVTASYCREGATRQAITLAAGSPGDAYSSGKWAEVDGANMRGVYQIHLPDAMFATGVNAVTLTLQASGVIDCRVKILLIDANLRDGAGLGLTRLDAKVGDVPAAILATPANLLATDGSGRVTVDDKTGYSLAADQSGVTVGTVNGLGATAQEQVNTQADQALTDYDAPTNAEMVARTLLSSEYALETTLEAVKLKTDGLPVDPASEENVSSRLAATDYTAPDNVGIATAAVQAAAANAKAGAIQTILTGITSLRAWLRLLARSDAADATAKTEINGGGGAYDEATDSLQAQADTSVSVDLKPVTDLLGTPAGASVSADVAAIAAAVGASGARAISVQVRTPDGDPVPLCRVWIAGVVSLNTDTAGDATLHLDDGAYVLNIYAPSYEAFEPVALVVSGDDTVTYTLTASAFPAPTAPGMCVVSFCILNGGTPIAGASVSAQLLESDSFASGNLLSLQTTSAVTDSNGQASLELVQKGQFERGSGRYQFRVLGADGTQWSYHTAALPNQESVEYADLF